MRVCGQRALSHHLAGPGPQARLSRRVVAAGAAVAGQEGPQQGWRQHVGTLSEPQQQEVLSKLAKGGYVGALEDFVLDLDEARLQQLGIEPMAVRSVLLWAFAQAKRGTPPPLIYKNIVLYSPLENTEGFGYFKRLMGRTTRSQIAAKLALKGHDLVARVHEPPAQPLHAASLPPGVEVFDIDEVELEDGVQLAVVLDAAPAPFALFAQQVKERGSEWDFAVGELSGWQGAHVAADEAKCAEWAVEELGRRGDAGVERLCVKELGGKVGSAHVRIEVDGLAASLSRVLLVERKQRISMGYVLELAAKAHRLRELAEAHAPNTGLLRDASTGLAKPIEAVLMADGWSGSERDVKLCRERMAQLGIEPVLPRGDTHAFGHSCHPWPAVERGVSDGA